MAVYTSAAWLWINRLNEGVAHAALNDGTRAVVLQEEGGTWRCVRAGVVLASGLATSGEAISVLQTNMRGDGILLRLRG